MKYKLLEEILQHKYTTFFPKSKKYNKVSWKREVVKRKAQTRPQRLHRRRQKIKNTLSQTICNPLEEH